MINVKRCFVLIALMNFCAQAQQPIFKKEYEYVFQKEFYRLTFIQLDNKEFLLRAAGSPDSIRFLDLENFKFAIDSVFKNLITSDSVRTIMSNYWRGKIESDLNQIPMNKVIESLESKIDSLQLNDKTPIGFIGFRTRTVPLTVSPDTTRKKLFDILLFPIRVFSPSKSDFLKVKSELIVKSAELAFEDGLIRDLQVEGTIKINDTIYDKHAKFQTQKALALRIPKDWSNLSLGRDELVYKRNGFEFKAKLSDILYVNRVITGPTGNYEPSGQTPVILNDSATIIKLYRKSFVDFIDFRLYTDIVGVNNNKPNGLLQFEGTYHLPLFYASWKRVYTSDVFFLKNMNFFVRFSKIENKLRDLKVGSGAVSTFDLLNYAKISTGIKGNLITIQSPTRDWGLDLTVAAYQTMLDSLLVGASFVSQEVFSFSMLWDLFFKFRYDDRINSEVRLGYQHFNGLGKDIRQFDSKLLKRTELSLNIHPSRASKNSIFLRWIGLFHKTRNDFFWQIGYKTSFNEIFGNKN
ncbi:hypothetical protein HUU42_05145 [bacterium]|nr:hypothetical protein [bacterium]